MAALEVLALNTSIPQIQAPQSGDTYTFPRAVELPLGTANGVLYLNGSKVVTSGSALTYNGTGFGIGISSAAGNLDVYTATTSIGYVRTANQTLKLTADDASGRVDIANAAGSPVSFTVGVTEQMRLTSTGLGIGTSSPGAKLHVEAASPTNGITQVLLASGSTGAQLQFTQSGIENWSIGQPAGSSAFAFWVGRSTIGAGTEAMRLDSTGLGIGTSSPLTRLNPQADNTNNDLGQVTISGSTNSNKRLSLGFHTTSNYGFIQSLIAGDNYYPLVLQGNGGNLGIGTSSPNTILSVNAGDGVGVLSPVITTQSSTTTYGGMYAVRDGAGDQRGLVWQTFTANVGLGEKMRLDSSGNLGLGVTPSVTDALYYRSFELGKNGSGLHAVTTSLTASELTWLTNNSYPTYSSGIVWKYGNDGSAVRYALEDGEHKWYTAPSGTAGNPISFTQAMTLDASGVLLVGTTSNLSGEPLQIDGNGVGSTVYTALIRNTSTSTSVYNIVRWGQNATGSAVGYIGTGGSTVGNPAFQNTFVVGTQTSNALVFNTNDAERARITSGGNFYVGTSSPSTDGRIVSDGADTYYAGTFTQPSAAANCIAVHNRGTSGDNAFVLFLTDGGSGTTRGSIDYDRAGGLVRYNTTSDYRAKDIIGPVQNPGATIDSLKVYEGVMKGATRSRPMLVAHEAQEHAPYAVSGVKDEVNEDGTPKFQQMDVSSLVPLLLAEIQSLRARLAAAGI